MSTLSKTCWNQFSCNLQKLIALLLLAGSVRASGQTYPVYTFTNFAGDVTSSGTSDGLGAAAHFYFPSSVALDADGNVFVADDWNGTIRKATPAGLVSTLVGPEASLWRPSGVAVGTNGNVYFTDTLHNTIKQVTPGGVVTVVAGSNDTFGKGTTDGVGTAARFTNPYGLAADNAGNLFVTDTGNHTIRKITPVGATWAVTTIAGDITKTNSSGAIVGWSTDGTNTVARFNNPESVAVDSAGNLYVADRSNHTIRKITPMGTDWVTTTPVGTAGTSGTANGTNNHAQFNGPYGVAVDGAGNLFVADTYNHQIRKVTPMGTNWVVTMIGGGSGSGTSDGIGAAARFNQPSGIAVDGAGNLFVADSMNNRISKGTPMYAPNITVQPQSQSNNVGVTVTFLVNAVGSDPMRYQWHKNGTNLVDGGNISGCSTNALTLSAISFNDTGSYRVVITNGYGSVTSSVAVLTVIKATPAIITPPTASAIAYGQTLASSFLNGGSASTPGAFAFVTSGLAPNAGSTNVSVIFTPTDTANYTTVTISVNVTVDKATAGVTLLDLSQTYDGTAKPVTATTIPANLMVSFTYDGSSAAPMNAGSYTVIGTIHDPNYQGNATGTLVIGKAAATVLLGNLSQPYDGTAKSVSAATTPAGLTVTLTYNGSVSAPINGGSYTVIGTINDQNYEGSVTGTLVITTCTALPAPSPLAPTCGGSVSTTTPTLSWNDVANESGYVVRVFGGGDCSGSPIYVSSQLATNVTSYQMPSAAGLQTGQTFSWQVKARGNGSSYCDSEWSSCCSFSISSPLPTNIVLVSPTGSLEAGSTQRYTWQNDTNAVWYELYVVRNGGTFCDQWFNLSALGSNTAIGSFAVDVGGHGSGTYQWWVRGWSPGKLGPWSAPMSFSLGIPGAATLLAPANNANLQARRPQFSWSQSSPAATWCYIYLTHNGSKFLDQWIQGATNWTPTADLPAGNYSWWVQTYNSAGLGPWSTNSTFTIPVAIPTSIVLVSPTASAPATTAQRYTWRVDAAATWYELYVVQSGKALCDKWLTLSDSLAQSGSGNFAVDVSGHTGGSYQWYVRGWSPDGLGSWSDPGSYTMTPPSPPGAVTLLTPTNNATVAERQPEFTWTASDPAADWYDVYVVRNGSKYAEQWVQGVTNWVPASGLPGGSYTWLVHPWNAVGYGQWSTNFSFTIQTAAPGVITLVSPSGSVAAGSTQRYAWKADTAATWYELYATRGGSMFCDKWYTSTNSAVDKATGNFAVDVNEHGSGTYQWWVRGWGPDGMGTWSTNLTFQLP